MITSSKINKLLQKNIIKNFPFGEVRKVCTYLSLASSDASYNVDTKVITETNSVSFNCEVIFTTFNFTMNQKMVQGIETEKIKEKDIKGLLFNYYCPVGFQPIVDDVVTITSTSEEYLVKGFLFDPYQTLFLLHLQPIKV